MSRIVITQAINTFKPTPFVLKGSSNKLVKTCNMIRKNIETEAAALYSIRLTPNDKLFQNFNQEKKR